MISTEKKSGIQFFIVFWVFVAGVVSCYKDPDTLTSLPETVHQRAQEVRSVHAFYRFLPGKGDLSGLTIRISESNDCQPLFSGPTKPIARPRIELVILGLKAGTYNLCSGNFFSSLFPFGLTIDWDAERENKNNCRHVMHLSEARGFAYGGLVIPSDESKLFRIHTIPPSGMEDEFVILENDVFFRRDLNFRISFTPISEDVKDVWRDSIFFKDKTLKFSFTASYCPKPLF